MSSVTTILAPWRDEVVTLAGQALRFVPARPIPRASLRRFERRTGFALPRDYLEFLARFGAARYFGAKLLGLRDLQPIYRYRESQVTSRKIPATGVLLFASVETIADFHFAFVFSTDLARERMDPSRLAVRAWAGDAATGWYTPQVRISSFSAWLERWPNIARRNARRARRA